jgi:hypothetical protein
MSDPDRTEDPELGSVPWLMANTGMSVEKATHWHDHFGPDIRRPLLYCGALRTFRPSQEMKSACGRTPRKYV